MLDSLRRYFFGKLSMSLTDELVHCTVGLCTGGIRDIQRSRSGNGSLEWVRPSGAKNICGLGICERAKKICRVDEYFRFL